MDWKCVIAFKCHKFIDEGKAANCHINHIHSVTGGWWSENTGQSCDPKSNPGVFAPDANHIAFCARVSSNIFDCFDTSHHLRDTWLCMWAGTHWNTYNVADRQDRNINQQWMIWLNLIKCWGFKITLGAPDNYYDHCVILVNAASTHGALYNNKMLRWSVWLWASTGQWGDSNLQ